LKILLLCQSLVYGGTQRQLALLAIGLKQRGHDVSIAVFYPGGPFAAELAAANVPIHDLMKRSRWDVAGFLARAWRLVAQERPDILYAFLPMANIVAALVTRLVWPRPRVVFGVRSARMNGADYDRLSRWQYRIEAQMSRSADLVIANSWAGLADIKGRGFHAARVIVIPNGIDSAKFAPNAAARKRLRGDWGVGEREILVGLVARFDPMKGHKIFFATAAQLARTDTAWRFACIGIGEGEEQVRARHIADAAGIQSQIIWVGNPVDVAACLSALDIACLASRFGEGFPNAVGEAMACGIPCVVTDVGDARAIVDNLGVVVPPNDPAALAAGLIALRTRLAGDRKPISDAQRRSIVERFGVAAVLERTVRELATLLD
jgi:glycosyltransferase involved in cell wall biosynthesis